jgi:uncharacterized protein YbjT (DUF2867 family)
MRVVIAGGHGQIALRMAKLLSARGDEAVGLIRNPGHVDEVRAAGAEPVILDFEATDIGELTELLSGADAVVFAAGAGPGSTKARKDSVDRAASTLLADAAQAAGVRRYLQVSAMGLDRADDPDMDEVFGAYLRAKAAAERELAEHDLDWTILRPGRLTNDPGVNTVELGESVGYGEISRDDVAAVLVALLDNPSTSGRTYELVGGDTPIGEALS